jgi:hypothetical protein
VDEGTHAARDGGAGAGVIRIATACLVALAIAGCAPDSIYEKDLLTANCTLVERMNVVTFIMNSDEDFDIGVRCEDKSYFEVLRAMQSYEYAVLAKSQAPGEAPTIEIVYCNEANRDQVSRSLEQLNARFAHTGFMFSLRPSSARCSDELDALPGALTASDSKSFDRQIK